MADITTIQKTNAKGWIIGAIVVVLVLLYVVFAGGSAPTGDATLQPGATPAIEPAPAVDPAPTPAATD